LRYKIDANLNDIKNQVKLEKIKLDKAIASLNKVKKDKEVAIPELEKKDKRRDSRRAN